MESHTYAPLGQAQCLLLSSAILWAQGSGGIKPSHPPHCFCASEGNKVGPAKKKKSPIVKFRDCRVIPSCKFSTPNFSLESVALSCRRRHDSRPHPVALSCRRRHHPNVSYISRLSFCDHYDVYCCYTLQLQPSNSTLTSCHCYLLDPLNCSTKN